MSPSAIKAAEPAQPSEHCSPRPDFRHQETSRCNFAAPGSFRNLKCFHLYRGKTQKSSSPSLFTYIPPSSKSCYPTASAISAGFTLTDGTLHPAPCPSLLLPPLAGSILREPLHLLLLCLWFTARSRKAFSHAIKFSLDVEGDQECLGWRKNSLLGLVIRI